MHGNDIEQSYTVWTNDNPKGRTVTTAELRAFKTSATYALEVDACSDPARLTFRTNGGSITNEHLKPIASKVLIALMTAHGDFRSLRELKSLVGCSSIKATKKQLDLVRQCLKATSKRENKDWFAQRRGESTANGPDSAWAFTPPETLRWIVCTPANQPAQTPCLRLVDALTVELSADGGLASVNGQLANPSAQRLSIVRATLRLGASEYQESRDVALPVGHDFRILSQTSAPLRNRTIEGRSSVDFSSLWRATSSGASPQNHRNAVLIFELTDGTEMSLESKTTLPMSEEVTMAYRVF